MDFSRNESGFARRYGGITAVTLMHVLGIYILVTGLGHRLIDVVRKPLEIKLVDQVKPPPPEMKAPVIPKMKVAPPPYIPLPDVPTNIQQENPASAFSSVAPPQAQPAQKEVLPVVETSLPPVVLRKGRAKGDWDSCMPAYPQVSMSFEEEGTTSIKFEVGADNQLKEALVVKSSGFPRLDKAALKALSACPFKAGMQDGKAVASNLIVNFVWSLTGGGWH